MAKEEKCVAYPGPWKQLKLTQSDPGGQTRASPGGRVLTRPTAWSLLPWGAKVPLTSHVPRSGSSFVTKDKGDQDVHLSPRTK